MKHITIEKWKAINNAAGQLGVMERGIRQAIKTKEEEKVRLIKQHARDAKSLPKTYTILYTGRGNLGTHRWPDQYTKVVEYRVFREVSVRETEKSLIVSNGYYKDVIRKSKILAYVW